MKWLLCIKKSTNTHVCSLAPTFYPPPTSPIAFLHLPIQALFKFTCPLYTPFENTVGKGEIARDSVFCSFRELSDIFIKLRLDDCRLQTRSVWKSIIFVV